MARPFVTTALLAGLALLFAGHRALAESSQPILSVEIDHARILEIERGAGTVIIGNPAIVDIEVLSENRLVLTGKSYGITNVVVLGRNDEIIMDEQVAVQSFEDNTVRVYRQASRQTYACAPKCEPTVTIGDNPATFGDAASQYETRRGIAEAAAGG